MANQFYYTNITVNFDNFSGNSGQKHNGLTLNVL